MLQGMRKMDGTGMEEPGESTGDSAGFIEEPAAEPQDSGSGTASQEIDGTVTENTEPESTQEALFSADVSLKNPAAGNDGGIPGEGNCFRRKLMKRTMTVLLKRQRQL